MPHHFIHYLRREIKAGAPGTADDHWYVLTQGQSEGFQRPAYHITRRQTGPSARIGVGDVIWLVSTLASPWGSLPPSVDARIEVAGVDKLPDGRTKFIAGEGSSWLLLADASAVLARLTTMDRYGTEKPLIRDHRNPPGLYLRAIRELKNPALLTEWSDSILQAPFHFVSYRIRDGLRPAFQHVQGLLAQNRVVFWDRYNLPRRLVERREIVADQALDDYLLEQISRSAVVWGIETPLYFAEGSYARREAELARSLGKYRAAP